MKKIFNNRNEPNEVINTANYTIGQNYSHFIGRTFQLDKHVVCVEDVIAEGGFSIVFLVKSNQNGKKYALKRMYVNNEVDLEICKREIRIIKTISEHNNKILKYIDSSIQRQTDEIFEILLLTKYCKLGGLVQLINDRLSTNSNAQLQENEIIKMFCDICEGLAELHEHDIIHRDLKIENILIDNVDSDKNKRGAPNPNSINYVLCDFGSATKKIFDRRLTSSSQQVQLVVDEIQKYTTLSYRSPEMVDLYSNKLITTKSDIWALGCLLYKICYFQMPFGESQLAIQEGRYTIPDNKAGYFSKQLNSLINFMLDPDPSKRPDIYQVSYLAFTLAQRSCPIKNINNSPVPSFDSLTPPLTESEWRNVQQQNLLKKQQANMSSTSTETTTTVNPRERPKGNLNNVNTKLPLACSKSVQNTPNKLQLPKKPPTVIVPQQPPQIAGFDDDFSSITPTNTNQSNSGVGQHMQTESHSIIPISTSSDFMQEQHSDFQQKKSHRRSASHSSSIFQANTPIITPQTNNYATYESRSTPTQQQQYQHQLHMQQQQWKFTSQQQQQMQNQQQPQNTPHLPGFINNRLAIPNHSRSASASPNVASKLNMASMAAQINQISKPPVPVPAATAPISTNINNPNIPVQRAAAASTEINQNPFNQNQSNSSNNPFGDNFSMLNDNDIFGLEFDRIRHSNEKNSTNNLNNQVNSKRRSKDKANKISSSSIQNKVSSSRSSSSSSELRQDNRNLSNSSEASSTQSSTYNRSASSSYFDSTEKKYSSASTIISADSSVFSKNISADIDEIKRKKKVSKGDKQKDTVDPFRQAPFRIQPSIPINLSSSESSNSSISEGKPSKFQIESASGSLQTIPSIQEQDGQKQLSAFQPYKRQADPFAGAPFDHVQKRMSPEIMTPGKLKAQHDRRRSKDKKTNANKEVLKISSSNDKNQNTFDEDDDSKNDEIIEVISKGKQKNFRTPSNAAKSSSNQNPFINAPFTAKKNSAKPSCIPFSLDEAPVAASTIASSISTMNSMEHNLNQPGIKPTVSTKPELPIKPDIPAKPYIQQQQTVLSLSRNLNKEIEQSSSYAPNLVKVTALQPTNKMTQSQSLNEIKIHNSRQLNENNSNKTANLIQQFNQQSQETSKTFKFIEDNNSNNNNRSTIEPVIDTSKLQFKKKPISVQGSISVANDKQAAPQSGASLSKKSNPVNKHTVLTKSQSQNESITIPQRNLVNINPAPNSSNQNESITIPQRNLVNINPAPNSSNQTNSSGGIANMSFDDY